MLKILQLLIHHIAIYLLDSIIHPLYNWAQSFSTWDIVSHPINSTLWHAGYTQTAWEQLVCYSQETFPNTSFYVCLVCSILFNIRIQVEQVFSGYTDIAKEELSIVHSIQTHFMSHVMNLNSRHHIKVLVSDGNQHTMDTWNNQFCWNMICNMTQVQCTLWWYLEVKMRHPSLTGTRGKSFQRYESIFSLKGHSEQLITCT